MTNIDIDDIQPKPKFWMGKLTIATDVQSKIAKEDIEKALARHSQGDWGDVCPEDAETNNDSLKSGGSFFSVYHDRNGVKFRIITDPDHNATVVQFPPDYSQCDSEFAPWNE
jgi:hypothetical protein